MDRLICGDVGFGKTEVALRAAFVAVMAGKQVAVVVPTTLLARQHYQRFTERFAGLPVRVAQLSRMVPAARGGRDQAGPGRGQNRHRHRHPRAAWPRASCFRHLGLLVIDEEQHFGVAQKEKLKQLNADVHVLTLTATPIPRTLQLALAGVREMSVIATPPIDRLAVRSFVLPYDPVVLREAIQRETLSRRPDVLCRARASPISTRCRRALQRLVPELKVRDRARQAGAERARGRDGGVRPARFDLLLSTDIIESGLDIPTANTLIVHRADMFGLAQLYQLRGRIGRSKQRAYAYFTVPPARC